jgi:predicted DNA repair protein MutK
VWPPKRELPIIKRIAIGSLRNKLLFILPAALLLSEFLPWLLTPILMLGGTYLCYEGAEKVWRSSPAPRPTRPAGASGPEHEEPMVAGAIRTDFILSGRDHGDRPQRGGRRAVRVPRDHPAGRRRRDHDPRVRRRGRDREDGRRRPPPHRADLHVRPTGRARDGPRDAGAAQRISVVGTAAMLWVGGHIILVGVDDLGWHWPYDLVHHWEEDIEHAVGGIGSAVAWLVNTFASLVIGVVWGFVVVGVMHVLPFRKKAAAAH